MKCPNCGAENTDTSTRCAQCLGAMVPDAQTKTRNPAPQQAAPQNQQQTYQQGQYQQSPQPMPPRPSNFLAGNIVFTILGACSCIGLITGIIGIVMSAQVNGKYDAGDYAGAQGLATAAKVLFFITMAITILLWLYFIFVFVVGIGSFGSEFWENFEYYYNQYSSNAPALRSFLKSLQV